jgi:hypothetical protein
MIHRTEGQYGINETILATALAAIVFPIIGVQPLTIVGFTGLINLFNCGCRRWLHLSTDVCRHQLRHHQAVPRRQLPPVPVLGADVSFDVKLPLLAAHRFPRADGAPSCTGPPPSSTSAITLASVRRCCRWTCTLTARPTVTDMTAACFGLYVGVVYIQKGAELLVFEFNDSTTAAGWLAAFIAVAFTVTTYLMEKAAHRSYGPLWLRQLLVDFTFIIGVIFWSGFAHIPGNMNSVPLEMVPITRSWFPTLQCVMSEASARLTS